MINKPNFRELKHLVIDNNDYLVPKVTEENFYLLVDIINELVDVVNELQQESEEQGTHRMEMKERN